MHWHVVLFALLLLLESFFLVISALPAQISMQRAFGDVELITYPGEHSQSRHHYLHLNTEGVSHVEENE